MLSLALLAAAQVQMPQPVGYVNDFAEVIEAGVKTDMQSVIQDVRRKSGGEIAVVTLRDIGGRPAIEVARDIGRRWGVGQQGGPGDRARNAGVVLLLVPGERPGDGRAQLAIATGTGAEGFITDLQAGRIRDVIGRTAVQTGSYGRGLLAGVWLLAEAYAAEFGFELTGAPPAIAPEPQARPAPDILKIIVVVFVVGAFFVAFIAPAVAGASQGYRRRYHRRVHGPSGREWLLLGMLLGGGRGGGRRGGWHGGSWGGGGFGGGGFGGFGGGGGFSGGGASGSF